MRSWIPIKPKILVLQGIPLKTFVGTGWFVKGWILICQGLRPAARWCRGGLATAFLLRKGACLWMQVSGHPPWDCHPPCSSSPPAGFPHFSRTPHFSIFFICRIGRLISCARFSHKYQAVALAKPLQCCWVRSETRGFTGFFAGPFTRPPGN